ncbi:hypothetical protein ACTA71_006621 [Dictyostelium dimigraforme]
MVKYYRVSGCYVLYSVLNSIANMASQEAFDFKSRFKRDPKEGLDANNLIFTYRRYYNSITTVIIVLIVRISYEKNGATASATTIITKDNNGNNNRNNYHLLS